MELTNKVKCFSEKCKRMHLITRVYSINVHTYLLISNFNSGIPIVVLFEVTPDNVNVTISALNLINEDGLLLESLSNVTDLGSNRYGAAFLPPSETFQLQVSGIDMNGYNFLRTSDTSIRITEVSLTLSKLIILYVFKSLYF